MGEMREIASGLEFPEGPVALPDGSLLVVEIQGQRLTRIGPDGSRDVVAEIPGGPNGAAIGPDGAVYVCNNGGFEWHRFLHFTFPGNQPHDYRGGSIQRVDLLSGAVTDLYTHCDGRPLRGPNDLVFDAHGGFWFTDHGKVRERDRDRTGVFYARADGSMIREVLFPLDAPNGVGLSADGGTLYVAETPTARVWSWRVTAPGEVAPANPLGAAGGSLLAGLPGMQELDSLAVDAEGNVCVGTLKNGGITVISADGSRIEHLPTADPLTTNICFGGPDLRTAFLTLSSTGRLVAMDWRCPGLRLEHASAAPRPAAAA
jgi:gluconolactonase